MADLYGGMDQYIIYPILEYSWMFDPGVAARKELGVPSQDRYGGRDWKLRNRDSATT